MFSYSEVHDNALQDLATKLQSDSRRGLPVDDEDDRAMRVEAFGSNRLADREEVSFGHLVREALEVGVSAFSCAAGCCYEFRCHEFRHLGGNCAITVAHGASARTPVGTLMLGGSSVAGAQASALLAARRTSLCSSSWSRA